MRRPDLAGAIALERDARGVEDQRAAAFGVGPDIEVSRLVRGERPDPERESQETRAARSKRNHRDAS